MVSYPPNSGPLERPILLLDRLDIATDYTSLQDITVCPRSIYHTVTES